MNWLLILILVVMAAFAINGYKVGIIRKAFSMFSFILTIVLASFVVPYVNDFIMHETPIYENVNIGLQNVISVDDTVDNAMQKNDMPQIVATIISGDLGQSIVSGIENQICEKLADSVIKGLAFAGSFALISLLLRTIIFTLDIIARLPIIRGINQYLGMLIGLAESIAIIWIFFILIVAFKDTQAGTVIMKCINESKILRFLYDNNLFWRFIGHMNF